MNTIEVEPEIQSMDNPHQEHKSNSAENLEDEGQNSRGKKRKRQTAETSEDSKKRSEVWKHFVEFYDKNGKQKARCMHCSKEIAADPKKNGTSGMNNHRKNCKLNPENRIQNYTIDSYTQSVDLRDMSSHVNAPGKFDQVAVREALAKMVAIDELPFKFVEGEGFRQFIAVACPQFVVPSRITVARDCLKLYFYEKSKLKDYFRKSSVRVCLTTDTWTSNQHSNYVCLTAHFLDEQWKLHKMVLNFVQCASHKGEAIGMLIEKCLLEWGIDNVFTNNASSNDTMVAYLKKRLVNWRKAICDGKFLHMRCVAHIIQLVVKDGLSEISAAVERIRIVVRYLRVSPSRWKKLKEYAEEEKITSKKLLCLDCPTRWNSCYFMLETGLIFRSVFERYYICDKDFHNDFTVGGTYGHIGLPCEDDWAVIERLVKVLKHFYRFTLRVSATKFVTSNVFLDEVSDIDTLIKQWTECNDKEVAEVAGRMKQKFDKYWGDPKKMNMMLFVVVVLDPHYKLTYVKFTLEDMYNEQLGCEISELATKALYELFEEYHKLYSSSCVRTSDTASMYSGQSCVTDSDSDAEKEAAKSRRMSRYLSSVGDNSNKNELEKYLKEDREPLDPNFDILDYWKVNSSRFPILARMARDLLAMPISTVASESTFSTSGRVIDDFRASLSPRMAQALICTQDWLRNEPPKPIEEDYGEIECIEEEEISSVNMQSMVFSL